MNADLLLALRHALENGPPTAEAHLRLGKALLDEGSPRAAEQEFRAAIALDRGCAGAWVNLGGVLFSRCDFAGALEANRRAAEAEPTLSLAHFNQGLAHLMSGDPQASLEAFGRAIELGPPSGTAYHHLAIALRALGQSLEAEVCDAYARELGFAPPGRAPGAAPDREASLPQPASPNRAVRTAAEGERHGAAQGR